MSNACGLSKIGRGHSPLPVINNGQWTLSSLSIISLMMATMEQLRCLSRSREKAFQWNGSDDYALMFLKGFNNINLYLFVHYVGRPITGRLKIGLRNNHWSHQLPNNYTAVHCSTAPLFLCSTAPLIY